MLVDQHDARAQRAGVLVGRLNELTARRRDRARQMAGGVFLGVADVEQIERAVRLLRSPAFDGGEADVLDLEALRDAVGGRFGALEAFVGCVERTLVLAAVRS